MSLQDSDNRDYPECEDEEDEVYEEELLYEKRAEIFSRAWAAWRVAEEILVDEPFAFGPQSFGLLAMGLLLNVIKDAMKK